MWPVLGIKVFLPIAETVAPVIASGTSAVDDSARTVSTRAATPTTTRPPAAPMRLLVAGHKLLAFTACKPIYAMTTAANLVASIAEIWVTA